MSIVRNTIFLIATMMASVTQADDKWDLPAVPSGPRVTTQGVTSQSISSGGCTVTVLPFAVGAQLTFTCPETAWRMNVRNSNKGLQVQRVEFRRKPADNFMRIIFAANIAEIFVPYHDGDPTHRLSDNQFCSSQLCVQEVTAQDIAGTAELITMQGDSKPTAAVEIRDRGLAWMCKWASGSRSRRGQDMVVWGTWDTGNYDYIIEYTFRDDGQVSFRLGATGWDNNQYTPGLAHMHDILWRVDIDINGAGNDSAVLVTHNEPLSGLVATDVETPFGNDKEGGSTLDPFKFETLLVEDAALNQRGHHYAYELQPFRRGASRHQENWCRDDIWVTRYHGQEPAVPALWTPPNHYLLGNSQYPLGIYDAEPINAKDLVIWHTSPIHHEPHDEDQSPTDAGNGYRGLTLVHWTGFDLVPHNLFDFNPLNAPDRSQCP